MMTESNDVQKIDEVETPVAKEQKKSKRVPILLLVLILILLLGNIGQGLYGYQLCKESTRLNELYSSELLYNNAVPLDEFYQWVDEGEDRLIYVGRASCPTCVEFAPTLYGVVSEMEMLDELYYLDVHSIRPSADDPGWLAFKDRFGKIEGTPSLIHIKDGETIDSLSWPEDGESVRTWLLAQK